MNNRWDTHLAPMAKNRRDICLGVPQRQVLLFVILLFALPAVAQFEYHFGKTIHLFPLFVDGDGLRTRLFVTNLADSANRCRLEMRGAGLGKDRFQSHAEVVFADSAADFDLAELGAGLALATSGEQPLATGYVILECDEAVAARLLLTSETKGTPTDITALESVRPALGFRFPLHRDTGSLFLAILNDTAYETECTIEVTDIESNAISREYSLAEKTSIIRAAEDLIDLPEGFEPYVLLLTCEHEVAAYSVLVSNETFAGLPAALVSDGRPPTSLHWIPLLADGGGFRTRMFLTNMFSETNRCRLLLGATDLDHDRFEIPVGVEIIDSRIDFEFPQPFDNLELNSRNDQPFAVGNAFLTCFDPVAIQNLLTAGAPGQLIGMTSLPSVPFARKVQFPFVSRQISHGVILANSSPGDGSCVLELTDHGGVFSHSATITITRQSTTISILDDQFDFPDGFSEGLVEVSCGSNTEAALLLVTDKFTVMPPVELPSSAPFGDAPYFGSFSRIGIQTYTVGSSNVNQRLPTAHGGTGNLGYSVMPEVPGLSFDETTRLLTGIPTRAGDYTITYTATDANGNTGRLTFTIRVMENPVSKQLIDSRGCTDGTFIAANAASSGFTDDCRALVDFANALIETGLLDEDNVLLRWGSDAQTRLMDWEGITVTAGRVVGLDLSDRALKGEIPPVVAQVSRLQRLNLANNEFTGPIPPELGNLVHLRSLELHNNNLTGIIPVELGRLSLLETLRLDSNELRGEIPAVLSGLTRLRIVYMQENMLSGVIPEPLFTNCFFEGGTISISCIFDVEMIHRSFDSDRDGVIDFDDAFPADHTRTTDSDGDGISDDQDPFPHESAIGEMRMFKNSLLIMPVDEHLTTEKLREDAYSREFYEYFEDEFDFLMMFSNVEDIEENQVTTYYGRATAVSNDIAGIGLSEFYRNSFGSAGKLKRLIHFPYLEGLLFGPGLHEVMHAWANFVLPTANASHWGFSSVNGQLGGFDPDKLVNLGNGRYSAPRFGLVANGGNSVPYSDLELYLAGFIPADEVTEIQYFEDGEWLMENEARVTDDNGNYLFSGTSQIMSVEQLIERHGEREPAWDESQKEFRAAAILLYNRGNPPSYRQMFSIVSQASVFSRRSPDTFRLYNFHEATRGQGAFFMDDLSDYHRAAATSRSASRSLPESHGSPPQPAHNHAH